MSVTAPLGLPGPGLLRGDPYVPPEGRVVGGRVPGGRFEAGDGRALDSLDFLLLNGPRAYDLGFVRDTAEPDHAHRGRMSTAGGGWSVTVDQHPRADEVFGDLDERGGHRVTHMARLTRTDGSAFDVQAAVEAAYGVAAAYSFAASHRCAPVLLAGSAGGTLLWAGASAPSVEPWTDRFRWTDPTHMHAQLVSVVSGWLDQSADPGRSLVLRLALGYHLVASNGSPADTAVLAGIAGLVLLSEARYVGGDRLRESRWEGLHTGGQIRRLLKEYGIGLQANPAYPDLLAVGLAARADDTAKKTAQKAAKGQTYNPPTDPPDDVDGVLALRNLVAHPSALARGQLPSRAWVEAWLTVGEWLDLALLARVAHQGRYFPRRQENRWQGSSVPVPFAAKAEALGP